MHLKHFSKFDSQIMSFSVDTSFKKIEKSAKQRTHLDVPILDLC